MSSAKAPWRVTWLTYFLLTIEVVSAKSGQVVGDSFEFKSAGPPKVGDFTVKDSGDFYLRINASGTYQIDIEEMR